MYFYMLLCNIPFLTSLKPRHGYFFGGSLPNLLKSWCYTYLKNGMIVNFVAFFFANS